MGMHCVGQCALLGCGFQILCSGYVVGVVELRKTCKLLGFQIIREIDLFSVTQRRVFLHIILTNNKTLFFQHAI